MIKTPLIITAFLILQATWAFTYEPKNLGEVYKLQLSEPATKALAFEVREHPMLT